MSEKVQFQTNVSIDVAFEVQPWQGDRAYGDQVLCTCRISSKGPRNCAARRIQFACSPIAPHRWLSTRRCISPPAFVERGSRSLGGAD